MSQHYFSEQPQAGTAPSTVRLAVGDLEVDLHVDSGVFSSKQIDRGTQILLEAAPAPTTAGDLLDIGCGYGPIAVAIASRYPDRKVWAIDINMRAVALTEKNAKQQGLKNIVCCKPDDVPPEVRFAGVYSNPPIRIGKGPLQALLLRWLDHLDTGGSAFLVVHKHLGSDSLARWLTSKNFSVQRLVSEHGYRVLSVNNLAAGSLGSKLLPSGFVASDRSSSSDI